MAQSAAHKHDSTPRATYQDVLDAPAHRVWQRTPSPSEPTCRKNDFGPSEPWDSCLEH